MICSHFLLSTGGGVAISNPKAMAAADVVDVDKATDGDTDLAITLSAKEADDAANLIKAEEVAYKQALENSLAGATDGSQLAEQALMMQGLSGAKASSDSNGSAHAGSQTNLVEVTAAAPTSVPTQAYSAPQTPLTDDNEVKPGSGKASVGAPPPEDIDLSLLCGDCGHPLKTLKGTRFLRKQPDGGKVYQCGSCNNKCTGLRRTFGTWPIEEFKGLDDEEKASFMGLASNKSKDLENELSNMLTKKFIESHKSSLKGQFLPLQVWATMGWDAQRIKETADPEDIEDTKLGPTYRVKIHETEEAKLEEKCRGEVMNLLNKYKGQKDSCSRKRGRSDSGDEDSSDESRHRRRTKKARRQERRHRRRSLSSRSRSPARVSAEAVKPATEVKPVEEVKPPLPLTTGVAADVNAAGVLDPKTQAALVKVAAAQALKVAKVKAAEQKKAESVAARVVAAEAKKAQTALAKEASARKASCSKAIKAVSAFATRFEQVIAEPLFKSLPQHIVDDAKQTNQGLAKIKQVAEANLDGRVQDTTSSVVLAADHIDVFTKNAPKVLKSIDEFFAAMSKYAPK